MHECWQQHLLVVADNGNVRAAHRDIKDPRHRVWQSNLLCSAATPFRVPIFIPLAVSLRFPFIFVSTVANTDTLLRSVVFSAPAVGSVASICDARDSIGICIGSFL